MTLRACESCDLISSAQLQASSGRWIYGGNVPGVLGTVVAGRNGNAIRLTTSGSSNYVNLLRNFDDQAMWIVGFAFRVDTLPNNDQRILGFGDAATDQVTVHLRTADRKLELRRGATVLATSTFVHASGAYNYVEAKVLIHGTTGTAELRVNQAVVATFAGDTNVTANAYANRISFGQATGPGGGAGDNYYDDIYINDGNGATNNDYIGDVLVKALLPTAEGALSDFTPLSGADNALMVDDAPGNDDTDYVSSATVGHIDTYLYPDLAANVNTIKAVVLTPRWRKDDAGGRTMSEVARVGGVNFSGTPIGIAQTYAYHERIMETNPATSAAWTRAEVDASEFGVKVES